MREVLDRVKEGRDNDELKTEVVLFERSDFNEKLSTNVGFGFQDLKPHSKMILEYLTSKYDIEVIPVMSGSNFSIKVFVKLGEKEFDLALN